MGTLENRAASEVTDSASKVTYPVDLVHLSRQTLGDRELEKEVLGLFVNQSTLYLKRLQASKSIKERKSVAHTILGSAKGLGAWQVAEEAARFEQQCSKKTDCQRLANAVDDANAYIREIMN